MSVQTYMENIPTWALILGSVLSSNTVLAIIGYIFLWPKQQADVHKTKTEAGKIGVETEKLDIENADKEIDLLAKAKAAAVEAFGDKMALEREKEARARDNSHKQFLIDFADREYKKLEEKFEKVFEDFILMKANENHCREKLAELEHFQKEQVKVNEKLTSYSDRNAQLTALVRRAHKEGFLSREVLEAANVPYDE